MKDRDYVIVLYDYYGELFNDKQKEYFEYYYFDNLSLQEISENLNISRNAIHKSLRKRTSGGFLDAMFLSAIMITGLLWAFVLGLSLR